MLAGRIADKKPRKIARLRELPTQSQITRHVWSKAGA
jgi:hypothetical protein